jgi:hypothetical protein
MRQRRSHILPIGIYGQGCDPNLTWTCGPVTNGYQRCFGPSYLPAYQVSGTTNHYARYSYDAAGNVTSDGQRQFTWDALGMLHATSFGGPQGRQFRYLYTADDERIAVIERKRGTDQVYRNRTSWTLRGLDARLLRVLVDDFTSGSLVQTWKCDPNGVTRSARRLRRSVVRLASMADV